MLIKPEKLKFENSTDIVDYVSKGMIPRRKDFEKVLSRVNCPDVEAIPNQVYIPETIFIDCDPDTMNTVIRRMYENRVRNRNICFVVAGVVAAGLLFSKFRNKDTDDKCIDNDSNSLSMDLDSTAEL